MTAALINHSHLRPKEPCQAADFMPSEWAKRSTIPQGDPTEAERQMIANQMRGVMTAMMQRNNKK